MGDERVENVSSSVECLDVSAQKGVDGWCWRVDVGWDELVLRVVEEGCWCLDVEDVGLTGVVCL